MFIFPHIFFSFYLFLPFFFFLLPVFQRFSHYYFFADFIWMYLEKHLFRKEMIFIWGVLKHFMFSYDDDKKKKMYSADLDILCATVLPKHWLHYIVGRGWVLWKEYKFYMQQNFKEFNIAWHKTATPKS